MRYLLKNARLFTDNADQKTTVIIENGCITHMASDFSEVELFPDDTIYNCDNCFLFPGFVDVHVHLREPGFLYKETIATGSAAAAAGGYTHVCAMPNLNPVPDGPETLQVQLEAIERTAAIHVIPYGAITIGEKGEALADLAGMAPYVAGFSDDGRGVQSPTMMKQAMEKAASLGKIIAAHCEDNSLLHGGYIHDGVYARAHGHRGICSESEWGPIARDIELARQTGCAYHVCHISTKESVAIIRRAKAEGVNITCETGPHYLTLCDEQLQEHGRFKMNPPIRGAADRDALIEGLLDGTIDMIATDHAPHSAEEKSKGLAGSAFGVVGIETAFPVLYTHLVKTGRMTLPALIAAMTSKPGKRFGIDTEIAVGKKANLCVYDLNTSYAIDPAGFVSMGKSTPFEGMEVSGTCLLTICDGAVAYEKEREEFCHAAR